MRWFAGLVVCILTGGVALVTLERRAAEADTLDVVEVNRVVKTIEADWPAAQAGSIPASTLDYSFVAVGGDLKPFLARRDSFVTVGVEGRIVGTVVIYNDVQSRVEAASRRTTTVFLGVSALVALACGAFALQQYRTITRPFGQLQRFAGSVARGDLELPLPMDRSNHFGAFTESFDLMRDQLKVAREAERQAVLGKRELVASLSHDIKTPVASIRVIAELFEAKHGPTPEMESIALRVDEIDLLITNLFSAALDELEQLKVSPVDMASTALEQLIVDCDYLNRVESFALPGCLVRADPLRLRQVVENVLDNSYKYAGTPIVVRGEFDAGFLVLVIADSGPGVSADELPMLTQKYYRAPSASGRPGSGLGLYLASYFMAAMGGSLSVARHAGFEVILRLAL